MIDSIWNEIVNSFNKRPRDVATSPINNSVPKWFYVFVSNGNVCIESGRTHKNVSSVKGTRRLNRAEFEDMLVLHHRRNRGEAVSQEAAQRTVNQVYWYGIFNELGL